MGLFTPKHRRIAEQGDRFRDAGNYAQAISTYEEAASMGSCYALHHLYKVYVSAPEPYRDDAKANQVLERMCHTALPKHDPWLQEQMTLWAKTTLGSRLYKGIGGDQDYERAFGLLSSIDPETDFDEKNQVRNILGYMYFQGLYVEQDYAKAYDYLGRSSQLDGRGEYALAYLYALGKGGARCDKNMALTLFRRACKEVPAARDMLCALSRPYLSTNPEIAEKNLAVAANYGCTAACEELVGFYFTHTATYTQYETSVGEDVLSRLESGMSTAEMRNVMEQYGERHITDERHENLGKRAKKHLETLVKQAEGILRAEDECDQKTLQDSARKALKRLMEHYAADCRLYGEDLYPRIEKITA